MDKMHTSQKGQRRTTKGRGTFSKPKKVSRESLSLSFSFSFSSLGAALWAGVELLLPLCGFAGLEGEEGALTPSLVGLLSAVPMSSRGESNLMTSWWALISNHYPQRGRIFCEY